MLIKSDPIRVKCEKLGKIVTLTKHTPTKPGATFSGVIEDCDHMQECGLELPFNLQKCEKMRTGA